MEQDTLWRDLAFTLLGVMWGGGVGLLISWLFHRKEFDALRAEVRRLNIKVDDERAHPSINITNIVNGRPKRAKLTGKFYIGSMFHPNLLQETMYPTVLVPEILIEQEDGTQEVLEIDGYKVVDDLGKEVRSDIEISDAFMFQLGRPDEPARIDLKITSVAEDHDE